MTKYPGLSERESRDLGRQIVKDNSSVRVKFGTTNGRRVLHVFVPGENQLGRTIDSKGGWESHPANTKTKKRDS